MPVTAPAREIETGTSIGKYEILRKLATGGMAEIYLARVRGTAGFEKLVVLKRILPQFAEDPTFVQMFLDEARLAATLRHPNIADVYDVGEAEGSFFFTMEFIHGEDARTIRIAAHKKRVTIPRSHALAIVHGTAAALAYAHDKVGPEGPLGLVHRDVSSSNVLISFDGAIKLVDFGIARATSRQHKTQTGTLKGKIPYMSPEQVQNRPLDRRSDLFSLGVVLYELTVGRRPFRGESDYEIFDQIINKGAPAPTSLDPEFPPDLEKIVLKALERRRESRYQNAEELVRDLEAFMSASGAWVSAMSLGRYMRDLFADKILAWETAIEHGSSLGDHVASTITSESMRAAMRVTPPSAFTAQPEIPPELPVIEVSHDLPDELKHSRRGLGLWVGIGGLAAAGIMAGIMLTREPSAPSAAPATSAPPAPTATVPTPTAAPTAPPRPAPTEPAAPPLVPAVAEPAQPAQATPPAQPAQPTVPAKGATAAKTPKLKPKTKPPDPAASTATKPTDPQTKPNKDKPWDRNSLSLPK